MEIPRAALHAVILLVVFTTLSFVVVCLRVYTRGILVKRAGIDDALIVASMLSAIAFLAVVMLQIKYGLGRQINREELGSFLMALWGTIPLYNAALSFCKLSITVQYYRVFRMATIQSLITVVIVALSIYTLWSVFGTIFTCWPVEKYWNFAEEGTCLDRNAITFANAGINIVTDLGLLALPIPLLHKLQIPRKQKIILVGVFACGALACAMSIIRLHSLYQIGVAPPARQSVEGVNIAIWSGIEINVGIICASIPALKTLGVRVLPKLLLSNLYARSRTPSGGRYIKHRNESISAAASRGIPDTPASDAATTKPHITIEQSFEMNTISAPDAAQVREPRRDRDSVWEVSCRPAASSTHSIA
jgi:hypothetical protein